MKIIWIILCLICITIIPFYLGVNSRERIFEKGYCIGKAQGEIDGRNIECVYEELREIHCDKEDCFVYSKEFKDKK